MNWQYFGVYVVIEVIIMAKCMYCARLWLVHDIDYNYY